MKLQLFLREQWIDRLTVQPTTSHILFSKFVGCDVSVNTMSVKDGIVSDHRELDSNVEELHAIRQDSFTPVVIISNDADVIVLGLHFHNLFKETPP